MKKFLLFLITSIILFSAVSSVAASDNIPLYLFYGETCSYCQKAKVFLNNLENKYPQIEIKSYEVFSNPENAKLYGQLLKAYNESASVRVPGIFIGEKVIIGYLGDETTGSQIEQLVKKYISEPDYPDPIKKISDADKPPKKDLPISLITVPFFGEIDLTKLSLPIITIIFGVLDGFNPCAMWILLFLIALLINQKSKKKMWLIGGVFIAASAIFYFLLLSAWLNIFLAIGYVKFIRIIIGLVAIVLGVWQLKKFFEYKPNVCQITDNTGIDEKLRSRAKRIVNNPLSWLTVGGVIILAISVNTVEFFCSAGLPAIYTQILAVSNLSPLGHYLYLLLYTFLFMLDDIIIFGVAISALSLFKMNEKYARWSGLVGAIVILLIGLLFIFKPNFLVF